ncbi:unnamed protein product [Protopolystoma xenopodis]|uniref:Uncharacterized protein n=1 Tax=Protopolystoma xenopodis TaxID=117903 RepID=A0A3S5BSX4_9PLAT|nr:unnamed protein product [Protopolystoma xenopodis]
MVICLAISVFFTTLYGVSFGDAACKKWFSALFIAFFTSMLLIEPIKVMAFALLLSLICKKTDTIERELEYEDEMLIEELGKRYRLRGDEEYLHEDYCK